ncbi:MAG: hypothetical protein M1816_007368 [Peltula sp. TS41687]|nr:MAG: hypothetical protein M1816_007368 [Peltula sp. TS41687]
MEDMRCSLPSISDLINSAGIAPSGNAEQCKRFSEDYEKPKILIKSLAERQTLMGNPQSQQPSQQAGGHDHSRVMLPPTPPLRPDYRFEGGQSPSSSSQHSSSSMMAHYPGPVYGHTELPQHSSLQGSSMSSRSTVPPSSIPYASPPGQMSAMPYTPSNDFSAGPPDWYSQRPPPQTFHPSALSNPMSGPSGTNPWQHHHHISPSSQAAFPPSQDRYICQTCSKAFSRPSSLRIHSHSHTGEKPFKCPHQGCGKAFSVRSNMKRHERGCHASSPSPM